MPRGCRKSGPRGPRRDWSEEELAFLISNYLHMTDKEIAEYITLVRGKQMLPMSVRIKRFKMGLTKGKAKGTQSKWKQAVRDQLKNPNSKPRG